MKKLDKKIIQSVEEEIEKIRDNEPRYYSLINNQVLLSAMVVNGKISVGVILNRKTGTIIKNCLLEKIKKSIGEENN